MERLLQVEVMHVKLQWSSLLQQLLMYFSIDRILAGRQVKTAKLPFLSHSSGPIDYQRPGRESFSCINFSDCCFKYNYGLYYTWPLYNYGGVT